MPWMQTTVPYGANYSPVQDAVMALHMAKTAAEGRVSFEFALYSRNEDYKVTHLLISPEVAEVGARLPGEWEVSPGPEGHEWSMLYGDVRSSELLGVKGRTIPR